MPALCLPCFFYSVRGNSWLFGPRLPTCILIKELRHPKACSTWFEKCFQQREVGETIELDPLRCSSDVRLAGWTFWSAGGSTWQALATWQRSSGLVSAAVLWLFQKQKHSHIDVDGPPFRSGEDLPADQHTHSLRAEVRPGRGLRQGLRRLRRLQDRNSQAEVQAHRRQVQRHGRWVFCFPNLFQTVSRTEKKNQNQKKTDKRRDLKRGA